MDEPTGANNGQNGELPPVSPTGNEPNPEATQDLNPPTGANNPEGSVPFHKDENTQYIIRQVTKNLSDMIQQMNRPNTMQNALPLTPMSADDDIEALTKEIMADNGLDETAAKKLALKM